MENLSTASQLAEDRNWDGSLWKGANSTTINGVFPCMAVGRFLKHFHGKIPCIAGWTHGLLQTNSLAKVLDGYSKLTGVPSAREHNN